MATESGTHTADAEPIVQLVTCEPDVPDATPLPRPVEAPTPTRDAAMATIEQTGADPPPMEA